MHVSPKFNKPQLAAVLQRWVQEALLLDPSTDQNKLYVEIKSMKQKQRQVDLTKAIYIEEDDGSVATFAISSPQGPKKPRKHEEPDQSSPGFDIIAGFPVTPEPDDHTIFDPPSTRTLAAASTGVIAEIESLAAIDISDPGVSTPCEETAREPDFGTSRPALGAPAVTDGRGNYACARTLHAPERSASTVLTRTVPTPAGASTPAQLPPQRKTPDSSPPSASLRIDLPGFGGAVNNDFQTPRATENVKIIKGLQGHDFSPLFNIPRAPSSAIGG